MKHVKNVDLFHGCTPDNDGAQGMEEWEIKDGREARVDAVELRSPALKTRCDSEIAIRHFADVIDLPTQMRTQQISASAPT
jgi:hypothetical protein